MKPHANQGLKGRLEVICGSMFSGKTERLIERIKRAELARQKVIVFKHTLDTLRALEHVSSHAGSKIPAVAVDDPTAMLKLTGSDVHVVAIDEVQFFPENVIEVVLELVNRGKRVVASGLDLDFRGRPFGPISDLLSLADDIKKLRAICLGCGEIAHFSQRLVNGKPAQAKDDTILIGANESYQARCRNCYVPCD